LKVILADWICNL